MMKQIIPILAMLLSLPAAAEGFRAQHTYPADYRNECGSCHNPFPPGMLNRSDWHQVMTALDRHYGTDASLDSPATRAAIAAWLERNAGQTRDAGGDPPRFSETAWFKREHRGRTRESLNQLGISTPAYCKGCHLATGQVPRYSENDISTTGQNRHYEDN
jgi:hypothetical protein